MSWGLTEDVVKNIFNEDLKANVFYTWWLILQTLVYIKTMPRDG